MITIEAQRGRESKAFTGPTSSAAFDAADAWGAVRIVTALGEVYRRLAGEWYLISKKGA